MAARLVFPESPIADDNAYLADLDRRALRAAHWRRGWQREYFRRADGAILRIGFLECPETCPCHDDDWWGDGT